MSAKVDINKSGYWHDQPVHIQFLLVDLAQLDALLPLAISENGGEEPQDF